MLLLSNYQNRSGLMLIKVPRQRGVMFQKVPRPYGHTKQKIKMNNRGFLEIIVLGVVATAILSGLALFTAYKAEQIVRQTNEQIFGATVTSPQLTDTIGTFRINVNGSLNALNAALSDTTSTDPGHKHTSSTITGVTYTKQVSEGGTATTTFIRGLVTASGTNAFGTLATNGSGSIPIASGTQFVANTLTAGSNITITNSSGTITIAATTINFATSTTIIPPFAGISMSTSSLAMAGNSTTMFSSLYHIPYQISIAKITYEITTVDAGNTGTYDVGIYSLDGQQKIAEATTHVLGGSKGATSTNITAALTPGMYYVNWIKNATPNVNFAVYISSDNLRFGTEPIVTGNIDVGSPPNALPSTFNPTALTSQAQAIMIRFDN